MQPDPGDLQSSLSSPSLWCLGHIYVAVLFVVLPVVFCQSASILAISPPHPAVSCKLFAGVLQIWFMWSWHWIRRILHRHLFWNKPTAWLSPFFVFQVPRSYGKIGVLADLDPAHCKNLCYQVNSKENLVNCILTTEMTILLFSLAKKAVFGLLKYGERLNCRLPCRRRN